MVEVVYLLNPGEHPVFVIRNMMALESGFTFLKSKTGVYVDPYGDTRLYPAHQKILADYWAQSNDSEILNFRNYLLEAISGAHPLLFVGD